MNEGLSQLAAGVFTGLASLPRTSRATTERLVAVACTLHLAPPGAVAEWMAGSHDVTQQAEKLQRWLSEADDDQDAFVRQFLLLITAQKASDGTTPDQVRSFAKQLHRQVNR